MSTIKDLTTETFDEAINSSTHTVVVDFYADWCMPCKMIVPVLERVAAENKDTVVVYKVNIDEHGDIAQRYSVTSIPYVISFRNGEKYKQVVGAQGLDAFLDLIQ